MEAWLRSQCCTPRTLHFPHDSDDLSTRLSLTSARRRLGQQSSKPFHARPGHGDFRSAPRTTQTPLYLHQVRAVYRTKVDVLQPLGNPDYCFLRKTKSPQPRGIVRCTRPTDQGARHRLLSWINDIQYSSAADKDRGAPQPPPTSISSLKRSAIPSLGRPNSSPNGKHASTLRRAATRAVSRLGRPRCHLAGHQPEPCPDS